MSVSTSNAKIAGIAIAVPKTKIKNPYLNRKDKNFIKHTGVKSFYSNSKVNTSELCIAASKKLLRNLNWKKKDIGFIIFVSQTRDHLLPQTSCKIQNKLNLEKDIITYDIPAGCTGFVNGLYLGQLLSKSLKKKGLLLCGDTVSKLIKKNDKKMKSLFGDCGSATAIEYDYKYRNKNYYEFGTDGSGANSLIYSSNGINDYLDKNYLYMDGAKIFEFALDKVPKQITKLIKRNKIKINDINYFIFHQANKYLIKNLGKKMKFDNKKILFSINNFGNTNSASIPVTIFNNHKKIINKKILISGFGVGLSWSAAIIDIKNLSISNLIKI